MKTSIRIDADRYEAMTPEAVKASVVRTARRVQAQAKPRRRRAFAIGTLATLTVLMSVLLGSFAFPDESKPEEPPKMETLVIYANGQGPWELSDDDLAVVYAAVMGSARGEDELVMQAVAQAIRNTCDDEGKSVSEVVEQRHYPLWEGDVSDEAKEAVGKMTENGRSAVDARIHYWYNPNIQDGEWFESTRHYICTIGNVRFFE